MADQSQNSAGLSPAFNAGGTPFEQKIAPVAATLTALRQQRQAQTGVAIHALGEIAAEKRGRKSRFTF